MKQTLHPFGDKIIPEFVNGEINLKRVFELCQK